MEFNSTILLIEDNLIDQLVTKQLLKKILDINQVAIANNGLEGLQWIIKNKKAKQEAYDKALYASYKGIGAMDFINTVLK